MILRSQRHHTQVQSIMTQSTAVQLALQEELEGYRLHSRLTIKRVQPADYGAYKCVSKNSLGETEGQIRLYEIVSESSSTAASLATTTPTTSKQPQPCLSR